MKANVLLSSRHINLSLDRQRKTTLGITNVSQGMVFYCLRTTSPNRYHVSERYGIIMPSSSATVTITALKSEVLADLCKEGEEGPTSASVASSSAPKRPSDHITDSFLLEYALIEEAEAKKLSSTKSHMEYHNARRQFLAEKKEKGQLGRRTITSRIFVLDGGEEDEERLERETSGGRGGSQRLMRSANESRGLSGVHSRRLSPGKGKKAGALESPKSGNRVGTKEKTGRNTCSRTLFFVLLVVLTSLVLQQCASWLLE